MLEESRGEGWGTAAREAVLILLLHRHDDLYVFARRRELLFIIILIYVYRYEVLLNGQLSSQFTPISRKYYVHLKQTSNRLLAVALVLRKTAAAIASGNEKGGNMHHHLHFIVKTDCHTRPPLLQKEPQ